MFTDKKIKYSRLTPSQIDTIIQRIDQNEKSLKKKDKNTKEAKALIILTAKLNAPINTIINLRSTDFYPLKKQKIKVLLKGKQQIITLKDPYIKQAWEYIKNVGPHELIFPTFRSKKIKKANGKTYTNYTDTYYNYIKKWSLSLNQHRTPSTFK